MIGERMKEILSVNNMSQKQFALLLKIPNTTLSGYINDKREPDFATLVDIAKTLNVTTDYLLGYHSLSDKPLNVNELSLLNSFRSLNKNQRELIEIQLEVMKNQNLSRKN